MLGVCRQILLVLAVAIGATQIFAAPEPLRIATYNVRNYLTMDRQVDGKFRRDYPKPEAEKEIVRETILAASPDILALQEIGTRAELLELRDDLAQNGLNYDSAYLLEAGDEVRRIGALWKSHLSISTRSHTDLEFTLFQERRSVKRGMLELQVKQSDGSSLSVFILHLKSKYTSDKRDPQSSQRRTKEAQSARERILERFPDPKKSCFLVVGDLNDHRNSGPVRRFLVRGNLEITTILNAQDPAGLIWTHYYKKGGEYSLLDYMLASPGLVEAYDTQSAVVALKDYYKGSDHRLAWTDLFAVARD